MQTDAVHSGVEMFFSKCGLGSSLLHLVRLRASQLIECDFCINMGAEYALLAGESQTRIDELSAWRDNPKFNYREQLALAWAEEVTLVAETGGPSSELYAQALTEFSDEGLFNLHLAVLCINAWNSFATTFHGPRGFGPHAE